MKTILQRILALKLNGFGGDCGHAAIEINEKIFGGKGRYFAGLNAFWFQRNRAVGHIAVFYRGGYWDARGRICEENLLAWGMIDPDDSDYAAPGFDEEAACDAILIELDGAKEVRKIMP